jgi:hypothetical protein
MAAAATKTSAPTPYIGSTTPVLEGSNQQYLLQELTRIGTAVATTQAMTPQSSVAPPKTSQKTNLDGQMRLARYPWWPVSGQTADAWVYYDQAGGVWRYLSTAPTSTH